MAIIKAKVLKEKLKELPDDMEISFGTSQFSKKPIVFYRFKSRSIDNMIIQIELNELEEDEFDINEANNRVTIGYFKSELESIPDEADLDIGSDIEGGVLEILRMEPVFMFSFKQNL